MLRGSMGYDLGVENTRRRSVVARLWDMLRVLRATDAVCRVAGRRFLSLSSSACASFGIVRITAINRPRSYRNRSRRDTCHTEAFLSLLSRAILVDVSPILALPINPMRASLVN